MMQKKQHLMNTKQHQVEDETAPYVTSINRNIATTSDNNADNDGGRFLSLSEIQLGRSTLSTLNIQTGIIK